MKTISLAFEGYWLEINKSGVPAQSGVYCVYACTYNQNKDTVTLRELVYVGESENVRNRLANHERLPDWKKRLTAGETLCYSVAAVSGSDRNRAEAAVIFHHKPPCNTEYKYSFPFESTTIQTSGRNTLLDSSFTVYRT